MPASIDAQGWDESILNTHGKKGRGVLSHLLAILELVDCRDEACLLHGRLVFHSHAGFKLILGCNVETTDLIVNTNDRSHTPCGLIAHQIDTIAIRFKHVKTVLGGL